MGTGERILVVEDDPAVREGLMETLLQEGFKVSAAPTARDADRLLRSEIPGLIVLDLMLPDEDGYDLLQKFRRERPEIPVLVLTARSEEVDKVLGLELGADDYVTKPFGSKELVARIRRSLRRAAQTEGRRGPPSCRVGELDVDFIAFRARRGRREVPMTRMEIEVVRYLALNAGRVVSRDELLQQVWGYDVSLSSRTVDTHVSQIRRKVEKDPSKPKVLVSVHGVGYRLDLGQEGA